jgi:hypothetical protein
LRRKRRVYISEEEDDDDDDAIEFASLTPALGFGVAALRFCAEERLRTPLMVISNSMVVSLRDGDLIIFANRFSS